MIDPTPSDPQMDGNDSTYIDGQSPADKEAQVDHAGGQDC